MFILNLGASGILIFLLSAILRDRFYRDSFRIRCKNLQRFDYRRVRTFFSRLNTFAWLVARRIINFSPFYVIIFSK